MPVEMARASWLAESSILRMRKMRLLVPEYAITTNLSVLMERREACLCWCGPCCLGAAIVTKGGGRPMPVVGGYDLPIGLNLNLNLKESP